MNKEKRKKNEVLSENRQLDIVFDFLRSLKCHIFLSKFLFTAFMNQNYLESLTMHDPHHKVSWDIVK